MAAVLKEEDYVRIKADTSLALSKTATAITNYEKAQAELTRSYIESAEVRLSEPLLRAEQNTMQIISTVDQLESTVDNVVRPALIQITSLLSSLEQTVPAKLDEIQGSIQEAEATITNDIQGSKDDILANLAYATDSIRYDIQALGAEMKDSISDAEQSIKYSIGQSTDSVKAKLDESTNLIASQVGQKAVEIEAAVKAGTEQVGTELQAVKDEIIQAYTTSVNEFIRLVANVEKILTDTFAVDEKKYEEEMNKAIETVRQLTPNYKE